MNDRFEWTRFSNRQYKNNLLEMKNDKIKAKYFMKI